MKPKILYLNDDTIYMRTSRVIPPEWRNGNELLKEFNPWLYDPETAQVQATTDNISATVLQEKAEDIIS